MTANVEFVRLFESGAQGRNCSRMMGSCHSRRWRVGEAFEVPIPVVSQQTGKSDRYSELSCAADQRSDRRGRMSRESPAPQVEPNIAWTATRTMHQDLLRGRWTYVLVLRAPIRVGTVAWTGQCCVGGTSLSYLERASPLLNGREILRWIRSIHAVHRPAARAGNSTCLTDWSRVRTFRADEP
jgi:hypothetical protein